MLSLILLIFALVLFIIAGFVNLIDPWRAKLCCIGFACWVGAQILLHAPGVLH